jgi:hypothetical protein
MFPGLARQREVFIHNVIHRLCGYQEKMNEIRGLVDRVRLGRNLTPGSLRLYLATEGQRNFRELPSENRSADGIVRPFPLLGILGQELSDFLFR